MNVRAEFDRIISASYSPRELRLQRALAEALEQRLRRSPMWKRMQGRSVTNRRVVVVDVPHGIAVGMLIVSFDLGGTQIAQNAAEIFKVVDGHIRSIEEFNVPGRVPTGSGFAGQ